MGVLWGGVRRVKHWWLGPDKDVNAFYSHHHRLNEQVKTSKGNSK